MEVFAYCVVGLLIATLIFIIIAVVRNNFRRKRDKLYSRRMYVKINNRISMADISTVEEGINAAKLGADILSTTLSGYTQFSQMTSDGPDFDLLESLVKETDKPVVLEGRIWEPEQVDKAFELGAHCVVIGSAITRPQLITKRFVQRSK